MKKFDLELAKAGDPVCLSDGTAVRVICFDKKGPAPVVALISSYSHEEGYEAIYTYTEQGLKAGYKNGVSSPITLYMAPVKHKVWVNLYQDHFGVGSKVFTSEERAVGDSRSYDCNGSCSLFILTQLMEWEE